MAVTRAQIVERASEMSKAFESATRTSNGESFRKLKDGSPEWMTDVIHAAHGSMMPDDFRYAMIEECIDALVEHDGDSDAALDSIEPEIYTAKLTAWLGSHNERVGFVDEAVEEYGSVEGGIVGMIQAGQLAEYREIMSLLVDALEAADGDNDSDA